MATVMKRPLFGKLPIFPHYTPTFAFFDKDPYFSLAYTSKGNGRGRSSYHIELNKIAVVVSQSRSGTPGSWKVFSITHLIKPADNTAPSLHYRHALKYRTGEPVLGIGTFFCEVLQHRAWMVDWSSGPKLLKILKS